MSVSVKPILLGTAIGGTIGTLGGAVVAFKKKKEELSQSQSILSRGSEDEPFKPKKTNAQWGVSDPIPTDCIHMRKNSEVMDAILEMSIHKPVNMEVFDSMCRSCDSLVELANFVSKPDSSIFPNMMRKGSTFLAKVKSALNSIGELVQTQNTPEFEDQRKQLELVLDNMFKTILSEVSSRM
tara:strand:+ start:168 stop:713 length:546 start_codon:yes stop_codon:yes gene_type:complete